jgi:hypothetical protein
MNNAHVYENENCKLYTKECKYIYTGDVHDIIKLYNAYPCKVKYFNKCGEQVNEETIDVPRVKISELKNGQKFFTNSRERLKLTKIDGADFDGLQYEAGDILAVAIDDNFRLRCFLHDYEVELADV